MSLGDCFGVKVLVEHAGGRSMPVIVVTGEFDVVAVILAAVVVTAVTVLAVIARP